MKYFLILFIIFTSIVQGNDIVFNTIITAAEKDFTKGTRSGLEEGFFKAGDTIYLRVDIEAKSISKDSINKIIPVTIYIPDSTDYDVDFIAGTLIHNNSSSDLKNEDTSHYFTVNTFVDSTEYKENTFYLKVKTKKATTIKIEVLYPKKYKSYNIITKYVVSEKNKKFLFF